MKDSFIFYRSYYESLSGLKDKDKLQLFDAICKLSLNENETKLTGICKNIFAAIKPQIVANSERYKNGKKGGRPKKETIGFSKKETIGFQNKKTNGYEMKKPNENVNENVNVNVNENVSSSNNNINNNNNISKIDELMIECLNTTNTNNIMECIEYLDKIPIELIEYGLKKTARTQFPSWKYAMTILDDYVKKGFTNLEQVKADELNFKSQLVKNETKEETEEEKIARKTRELEEAMKNANK